MNEVTDMAEPTDTPHVEDVKEILPNNWIFQHPMVNAIETMIITS